MIANQRHLWSISNWTRLHVKMLLWAAHNWRGCGIPAKNQHQLLLLTILFFFPSQFHLQSGSTYSRTYSRTNYNSISSSENEDTPIPSIHPLLAVCVAVVASSVCVAVAVGPTLIPQTQVTKLDINTTHIELSWIWCVIALTAFYPVSTFCIKRYLSRKKDNIINNNFVAQRDKSTGWKWNAIVG